MLSLYFNKNIKIAGILIGKRIGNRGQGQAKWCDETQYFVQKIHINKN